MRGLGDAEPAVDGITVRVATTSGLATTSEVVRRLETTGFEVSSLQLRQPSLDEVFLSLTGREPSSGTEEVSDGQQASEGTRIR